MKRIRISKSRLYFEKADGTPEKVLETLRENYFTESDIKRMKE